MPLRHVLSNLRQGLRRHLSMHVAVVLTLFVSLSLAGVGLMLTKQADLTADELGTELQVQVTLCVPDDRNPRCPTEVTDAQRAAIDQVIDDSPEVASWYEESKEESFDRIKRQFGEEQFEGPDAPFTVDDVPQTLWITLKDAEDYDGLQSALLFQDGVRDFVPAQDIVGPIFTIIDALKYAAWGAAGVLVLAAVLLVFNTIRLTALARRKEIEIMRLVGASRVFIGLPFVLEALVVAALGVGLAAGALAAFTKFAVIDWLSPRLTAIPFVGWTDYTDTLVLLAIAGPVLTVVPTLLLTRKYLRL
ncbi:MAG: cell division protein FtsX [Nocardioides sp.]|nr:cell division protein FtsX [Nocardioides sp.]